MAQIGFPLDSKIIGYDDSGLPIYSHQYHSEDYRNVLKEMFSNGVLSSGDMLKPAAYYLGGNTFEITVRPGAAIINGAIFINDGVEVYQQAIPAAPSGGQVTKHYHVVIGLDTLKTNGDENMTMYVKPAIANQSPEEDLKSWEICLATATVIVDSLASEPYVTFVDRRLDPDWCGLAAPFAELDTSQFYYDLQKDIEKLNDQTDTAVELAKDALDETVAGNLTERIGSLEDDAALIANGTELSINNNSLVMATVPGSYYIEADDLSKYNDLPDDWPNYFTRLYIVDIGKNASGYESVMQVLITRFSYETGKWKSDTRTRIINRDSATIVGSSPWQKIITGKVSTDDIESGSITAGLLKTDNFSVNPYMTINKRGGVAVLTIWGYILTGDEPTRPSEPTNTSRVIIGKIPAGFRPLAITAITNPSTPEKWYGYIQGEEIWIQKKDVPVGSTLYGSCVYVL